MDVDSPDYRNLLDDVLLESNPSLEDDIFIKQTILHSPIFTNIIPDFKVCINKKIAGLPSSSINDEADQTLLPPEEDSQFDAFDEDSDDEMLFMDTDQNDSSNASKVDTKIEDQPKQKQELFTVRVIVKTTSILVDDAEYALNSAVRSSCVLRGISYDNVDANEDSLFLSTTSGYIFLIRLFRVPRDYSMDSHDTGCTIDPNSNFIIKPYIVQWWDTSGSSALSLTTSGHKLQAHSSGLCVVSTSASDAFRIYNCQHTEAGLMCLPHFNVPVNGVILQSCFAEPMNKSIMDNHMSFLTLQFSESRRLEAHLHSWSWSESVEETFEKCMLPLPNDFPVPIFIIPLARNSSFLFVSQTLLTIVTIHQILSADFSFNHFPFNGSFATNYFISDDFDLHDEKTDCVLVSTDDGSIYSVLVTDNSKLTMTPIVRVSDPISIFALEKTMNNYRLTFGSDTGSNRELIVELFDKEYTSSLLPNQKPKYSAGSLVTDFKSWSPILDISIIDSFKSRSITSPSNQELWALTGSGRRTRLTQLRKGHNAFRKSKTYEKLRKSSKLWFHTLSDRHFLFCRLPFETTVLEYQPGVEDCLYEIEEPKIITDDYSLLFRKTHESSIIQVTRNSVALSNMFDMKSLKLDYPSITSADIFEKYLVLVLDKNGSSEIQLLEILEDFQREESATESGFAQPVSRSILDYQISFVKLIKLDSILYVLCGDYGGNLIISQLIDGTFVYHNIIPLTSFLPCMDNPNFSLQNMVVNDLVYSQKKECLFLGSKDGFYMHLQLRAGFKIECKKFLKLGSTPVAIHLVPTDENFLLVNARGLWVVNLYESPYPSKVYLEEKTDRAIMCAAPFEMNMTNQNHLTFAFVRDEGLTMGSISLHRGAVVKQMNIMEPARRLLYLPYLSCFVILCNTKGAKQKLKFIDRKTFKLIPHQESLSKADTEKNSFGLFKEDDIPISVCVWSIKRGDKVSKKLLIGSDKGSFKILNISKLLSPIDQSMYLHVTELSSFDHQEPISNIQQIGGVIFYSCGNRISSTALRADERKLQPVQVHQTLASTIVSMSVSEVNTLLVTTKFNSVFVFEFSNLDGGELKLVTRDLRIKSLVNQAKIGSQIIASDKLHSSVSFMKSNDNLLLERDTIQLSSIARVYASKFYSSWIEGDAANQEDGQPGHHIFCVGVNGEVVSIKACSSKGREIQSLTSRLGLSDYTQLKSYIDRLDRPFADKVNGKGFRPIHRPHFDFTSNKGKVVDYDLEEFARVRNEDICI